MTTLITVTQAGEKWGVSRTTVLRWVWQNRIQWSKIGRDILIPEDEKPPERAARGTLTEEQRAVNRGGPPSRKSRGGK